MRIGIDIRNLTQDLSGTSRYIYFLFKELLKINKNIYGFSPYKIKKEYFFKKNFYKNIIEGKFLKSNIFRFVWGLFFLKNQIKKKKIDIFWGAAHRLPFNLPNNIIKVLTIFDLTFYKNPKSMNYFDLFKEYLLTPKSIKQADIIIVPSESTKKDLIEFDNTTKKKIKVIKLGNFFKKTKIKKNNNHFSNLYKPYLLFVGSVSPRKNLENFICSFSKLPDYLQNNYNVVIIGNLNYRKNNLKSLIREKKIEKSVFFMGKTPDKDLKFFYKNAEYLIFPSIREGFGLPIVEAQSFGTPVIASGTSSLPEVAGKQSIYFNPYSITNMTKVLKSTLKNKSIRKKKSLELLKQQSRSWKITAIELYKTLTNLKKNV